MSAPQGVRIYGETRAFSGEAMKYGNPESTHRRVGIDDLREEIAERVNGLTSDEVLGISFAGFPGVGKTSQLRHMIAAATKVLGGGKAPLISYVHPETGEDTFAGRKARDGIVGVVHGDHMFRAIGPDRRGAMLDSPTNFEHFWGDDIRLSKIFWDIVAGKSPREKVYRGTLREKGTKLPLGEVKVLDRPKEGEKKVMILEGVQTNNSLRVVESQRNRYRLSAMKILFDVSILDSMIRLLRREHDEKKHPNGTPYTFPEILEHRLIEQYYILRTFIGPTYRDDEVLLLDKAREMPPFRKHERDEILSFLASFRLAPRHSTDMDLSKFVYGLIARLEDYFSALPGVDEAEYRAWRSARLEKKKRQAMELASL